MNDVKLKIEAAINARECLGSIKAGTDFLKEQEKVQEDLQEAITELQDQSQQIKETDDLFAVNLGDIYHVRI